MSRRKSPIRITCCGCVHSPEQISINWEHPRRCSPPRVEPADDCSGGLVYEAPFFLSGVASLRGFPPCSPITVWVNSGTRQSAFSERNLAGHFRWEDSRLGSDSPHYGATIVEGRTAFRRSWASFSIRFRSSNRSKYISRVKKTWGRVVGYLERVGLIRGLESLKIGTPPASPSSHKVALRPAIHCPRCFGGLMIVRSSAKE